MSTRSAGLPQDRTQQRAVRSVYHRINSDCAFSRRCTLARCHRTEERHPGGARSAPPLTAWTADTGSPARGRRAERRVSVQCGAGPGAAASGLAAPPRQPARPAHQTVGAPCGGVAAASCRFRVAGRSPARGEGRPGRDERGQEPARRACETARSRRSRRSPARRVRLAAGRSAGVAREGKDRGVAVPASGREPFPEIGVRAGSAPPRRDARRLPWPGTPNALPSMSHGEVV